jgi:hypothetical protein
VTWPGAAAAARLGALLLLALMVPARAAPVTEILYEDRKADGSAYPSRVLMLGERLRMDFGRDEDDFILYDRQARMVWLVNRAQRRITEIPAAPNRLKPPKGWRIRLDSQPSDGQRLGQARLNDQLCAEYKNAPLLRDEARLMADYRRALAGSRAAAWTATPARQRDGCQWLMDIQEAGVEYRQGLLLALRHADGRSRVYRGHASRELPAEMFELPADHERTRVGAGK